MAQAKPQAIGEPVNDPVEILRQGLAQDAAGFIEEAGARLADSSKSMVTYEAQAQAPRVITNETIDQLYDRVSGTKYVATLPAGSKVSAKTKNMWTRKLDDGSIELSVNSPVFVTNTNPDQVARASNQKAANPSTYTFDVDAEMGKLKGLRGEELQTAIISLMSNIDTSITKSRQRIGQQASIESGYTSAQAALERSIAAEHLPNPAFGGMSFNQRFGFASAQTQNAQSFASATRTQMTALEQSMVNKDLEISKLASAKNALLNIEAVSLKRQLHAEDKQEMINAAVPADAVANYKYLNGRDISDDKAKGAIIATADKDKSMHKILATNEDTIYTNLFDQDLKVRDGSFKILIERDKALNPNIISADAKETPVSQMIRSFVKEPTSLIDASIKAGILSKEDAGKFKTQMAGADNKEKASIQQGALAALLEKYVQKQFVNSYMNMTKWKATEIGDNTPLGVVINRVSKTNPNGSAPLFTVIDSFIMDQTLKNPDGQIIPYEQRVATLEAALTGTISSDFKSMLLPNKEGVQVGLANQIRNAAARTHIRSRTDLGNQTMGVSPGFSYEIQKGFVK